MAADLDRFLRHRTVVSGRQALGRVYQVLQESWPLQADPRLVRARVQVVASRRTASEAADLAREAAVAFRRHGFHKPSAAWWGADETTFHRFRVSGRRPGGRTALTLVLLSGLTGLAALSLSRRRRGAKADGDESD